MKPVRKRTCKKENPMNKKEFWDTLKTPPFVNHDCWSCINNYNGVCEYFECGALHSEDKGNPLNMWKWNGVSHPIDEDDFYK